MTACPSPSGGSQTLQYIITFNTHGGTAVNSITADEGTRVTRPAPDPVKTGYDFTGWYSAETGGTQFAWPHTLTGHITMHAQWQAAGPSQYTVTFDTHDGTPVGSVTANENTAVPKPPDPAKEGWTFTGWYSEETGGALYAWPYNLAADVTMHAHWRDSSLPPPAQHTVTFHPAGGSPAPEPQSVAEGAKAGEPAITRPQGGLFSGAVDVNSLSVSFSGWYDNPSYSGSAWDFDSPVTGNLELYAKWDEPANAIDISGESGENIVTKALAYLRKQTLSVTTNYTIVVDGDSEDYTMLDNSYDQQDPPNITMANAVITLTGKVPMEIHPGYYGSAFRISAGTLILGNNITLNLAGSQESN